MGMQIGLAAALVCWLPFYIWTEYRWEPTAVCLDEAHRFAAVFGNRCQRLSDACGRTRIMRCG